MKENLTLIVVAIFVILFLIGSIYGNYKNSLPKLTIESLCKQIFDTYPLANYILFQKTDFGYFRPLFFSKAELNKDSKKYYTVRRNRKIYHKYKNIDLDFKTLKEHNNAFGKLKYHKLFFREGIVKIISGNEIVK